MKTYTLNNLINFRDKKEQVICIACGCTIFIISLIFSNFYIDGDQRGYHQAYELVSGLGFTDRWSEINSIYQSVITSAEYMHLIVLLIFGGIDVQKNLLMSVLNGILAAYTVRLIFLWGGNLWIALVLVISNYYFYVLYFAAERLKLAILFLIFSLLCSKKTINFTVNCFFSIFSHLSVILIYVGIGLVVLTKFFKKNTPHNWLILILSILVVLFFLLWNWDYIIWKINTYKSLHDSWKITNILPIISLMSLSIFYAKNKWEPIQLFLPVIIGTTIIGGSRLNMFGFFIFLYYGIKVKGGNNVGTIAILSYLSFKTIGFLKNIIFNGDGFILTK